MPGVGISARHQMLVLGCGHQVLVLGCVHQMLVFGCGHLSHGGIRRLRDQHRINKVRNVCHESCWKPFKLT